MTIDDTTLARASEYLDGVVNKPGLTRLDRSAAAQDHAERSAVMALLSGSHTEAIVWALLAVRATLEAKR